MTMPPSEALWSLLLPADGADRVVVQSLHDPALDAVAARVRPGGRLLVVVPAGRRGRTLPDRASSTLSARGLAVGGVWWVGGALSDPSWSLPAGSPAVTAWFLRDWFVPWSRREVVTTWSAAVRRRGWPGRVATGLALLGRRPPDRGADAAC